MSAIDFILDADNDLAEGTDGDFVEGESDGQHIQDLLLLEPGELVYDPLMGIALERYRNGSADEYLYKTIHLQLQADNYQVEGLVIEENEQIENIEIDAIRDR